MGRHSFLGLGEVEVEICPKCGVPQGSPLSPPLFLVFIDDLLWILGRIREVGVQAFADDLAAWASGDFRDGRTHWGLRVALRAVGGWASFWRVIFSVAKCEAILFRNWQTWIARPFEARLGSGVIPHVRVVRYLGVWFDDFLTWGRQVEELLVMARRWLWALRHCIGRSWGLDPYTFLLFVRRALCATDVLRGRMLGLSPSHGDTPWSAGRGAGTGCLDGIPVGAHHFERGGAGACWAAPREDPYLAAPLQLHGPQGLGSTGGPRPRPDPSSPRLGSGAGLDVVPAFCGGTDPLRSIPTHQRSSLESHGPSTHSGVAGTVDYSGGGVFASRGTTDGGMRVET